MGRFNDLVTIPLVQLSDDHIRVIMFTLIFKPVKGLKLITDQLLVREVSNYFGAFQNNIKSGIVFTLRNTLFSRKKTKTDS